MRSLPPRGSGWVSSFVNPRPTRYHEAVLTSLPHLRLLQVRSTSLLNRRSQFFWCRRTAVHAVDLFHVQSQLLSLLVKTNRRVLRTWNCSVGCRVEQVSLKQNLLSGQVHRQHFICMRIRSNVAHLHQVFVVLKNSLLVCDRLNSQLVTGRQLRQQRRLGGRGASSASFQYLPCVAKRPGWCRPDR